VTPIWTDPRHGVRFLESQTLRAIGGGYSSGRLVMCKATMQWSARTASGFHFETDPNAPTTSVFAQLGKVTNGVFAG